MKTKQSNFRFSDGFTAKLTKRAKGLKISKRELLERAFDDSAEWAAMSPNHRLWLTSEAARTKRTRLQVLESLISKGANA